MGDFKKNHTQRNHESKKVVINHIQEVLLSSPSVEKMPYVFPWKRKIIHLLFSFPGFLLISLPKYSSVIAWVISGLTILMVINDTIRLSSKTVNKAAYKYGKGIFTQRDYKRYSSGTFYMLGCCLVVYIFEPTTAGLGIITLAFGDFSASFGGYYFKKYVPFKLPYSHKTYIGVISFIVAVTVVGVLLGFNVKYLMITALVSSLAEAYVTYIDDNILLPLVGSFTYFLLML